MAWPTEGGNVYFTNGGDDPWQRASVTHSLTSAMVENTAECLDCGHCGDLSAPFPDDPPPLTRQREEFTGLLSKWLAVNPPQARE